MAKIFKTSGYFMYSIMLQLLTHYFKQKKRYDKRVNKKRKLIVEEQILKLTLKNCLNIEIAGHDYR